MPNGKKQPNNKARKAQKQTTVTTVVRRQTRNRSKRVVPNNTRSSGTSRIRAHTESFSDFVGEISSTSAFLARKYLINPYNATLFPQLKDLAALYEKYRIVSLTFRLVPKVSSYKSSGTVAMAWEIDPSDVDMTHISELHNSEYHTDNMPDKASVLKLPRQDEWLFVEDTDVAREARFENYGALYVATSGNDESVPVVADLFVSGTIEFVGRHQPHAPQDMLTAKLSFEPGTTNANYETIKPTAKSESSIFISKAPYPTSKIPMTSIEFSTPGNYLVQAKVEDTGDGTLKTPALELYDTNGQTIPWGPHSMHASINSGTFSSDGRYFEQMVTITQDALTRNAGRVLLWWINMGVSAVAGYLTAQRVLPSNLPALQ